MDKAILEVIGLKKYFPVYSGLFRHQTGEIKAVDGIDFKIPEGKVLGMVGESGSGKSTAGRAAIRLIEPTGGQIIYRGEDLLGFKGERLKEVRRQIQIVFQDPYASLNPRKSIAKSIGEALLYHRIVANEGELLERVGEILKMIGLSPDAMHRYPHQFSGGQQQRICIGRAVAMNPRLIVCDEAVSALDVSVQAQILNLLDELKARLGLSYLFISHDLGVIRHISDYVVVMNRGKVVESGSVEEIFGNPQDSYTRKLLAAIPRSRPRRKTASAP